MIRVVSSWKRVLTPTDALTCGALPSGGVTPHTDRSDILGPRLASAQTRYVSRKQLIMNPSKIEWEFVLLLQNACFVAHRSVLLKVNGGIEIKIQPVISSTLIFKNFNTCNEKYGNDYYAIGMSQVYSNMQSEKGNLNCKCKFWFSHLLTFILSFSPCNIFMLYIT